MSKPTEEPAEKKPIRCEECDREFKTLAGFSSHERNIHWFDTACPICEGGGGRGCDWHFM